LLQLLNLKSLCFLYLFGGLECVGHSFAYVGHFVFLRDVWIQIRRAAVASRRVTNLTTHFSFGRQIDITLISTLFNFFDFS
jgi:hypothetical protein